MPARYFLKPSKKMNKPTSNDSRDDFIQLPGPGNFKLDEIEWWVSEYPTHLNSMPFENTTKKLLKELSEQ